MDEPLSRPCKGTEENSLLLDFFIVLAKYGRMIISVSLAVTILTYLYLFISPNLYKAKADLLPPQQNLTLSAQLLESLGGSAIPGKATATNFLPLSGLLGLKSPSDFYVGLMSTDVIFDRMIERFNLRQVYKTKYNEDARRKLRQQTFFQVGRKDGIISVEVTDKDPKRGAALANAFVEGLDKLLQELVTQEARARLAFLEKEVAHVSLNLTKAEEELRAFSEKNSVIQIDTQTRGTLEYIARMRAEIDTKEVQMKVLRYQATPRNTEMVRLEMELNGLKEKLQAAECNQVPGSDVCLTTSKVPTLGLEYIRLYREVKFQDGLYQLYTKMVEIARLDMVKEFAVVQLLNRAQPAEKRSNRRLFPAVLIGMVCFVVTIMAAWYREAWEKNRIQRGESMRWGLLLAYLEPWRQSGNRIVSLFKRKKY